ncbi:SCO7613 C-terminal domain-containing membrane protein [Nocardioides sp. SYSU D00038]|uniref:SCO7613 C-terminal domain-containing membrane protein n=1 Tax=Nocardioides sp. SYSU D00038 TaxID=2812554 RepID=UPI0019680F88|nr:hypothetical protein [Nocardioides sp. SYSU D00038]
MPRYADPSRCPDCRATLPARPAACPACDLPLRGPLVTELFRTLQRADVLLEGVRATATAPAPVPAGIPAPTPTPAPGPYPAPAPFPPRRTGISGASVPKVLLGLGATCLLVAAVIFLAVAWSWLGIGGRTAVLVVLTVVALGLSVGLAGRGLRVAGESLSAVGLGLLVLDVFGAADAGWLGVDGNGLAVLLGLVLAAVAAALVALRRELVVPQLAILLGAVLVGGGALALSGRTATVLVLAVVGTAAVAEAGRRGRLPVLAWGAAGLAGCWWLGLLAEAAQRLTDPTLHLLWADLEVLPLLAAAGLALLPLVVVRDDLLGQACGAVSATLVTVAVTLPGWDESANRFALAALATLVAWTAVLAVAPGRWRAVPLVPLGLAAVPVTGCIAGLLADAGASLGDVGPIFGSGAGVRIDPVPGVLEPLLLPALVVGLLVAAWVALPAALSHLPTYAAVAGLALVATVALHPVPLAVVVALVAGTGAALALEAVRRTEPRDLARTCSGLGLVVVAGLVALPSEVLTLGVAGVLVAVSAVVLRLGAHRGADEVGGLVLPLAVTAFLLLGADVVGVDRAWWGAPVLLSLGLLALARPQLETEVAAALGGATAAVVAVGGAVDQPTAAALHLTLAGVLVTASAVVHLDRRLLAWPGGLLLAAATWVRLADVGVTAPEPYTLPSAVALLAVGVHRLLRDPHAATGATLGAGLGLATVPSLLWALVDPVSLRAALLGVGCLALVLFGTRLRWNAPVVAGAVVGGVLVLRELAPYAAQTPQWLLIGLAGTVLTVVGVTWEKRMHDLQQAAAYLGRLR